MIKPGMRALIRGGEFVVTGKSEKKGHWCLCMEAKMIRRKKEFISIEIPESEVLEGVEAYRAEEVAEDVARRCTRQESVLKDVFKARFLLTKMEADDPNTH